MSEYEALQQYNDMLDEIYPEVEICGYTYSASKSFKEIDPIAYQCGFNDFCDAENIEID